ncbi:response regulator transcription factor [Parabacteroides provencensis]|uniref:response regulator transcription factor n=1 Tax=Parabacteroides provencensis TaxID=1944636 RepID=UPI000C14B962|nr:response regulator transcription factor [Parabacteroides provencensis]
MHRNKQIAIILPDTLQSLGLYSLLNEYFPPVEVNSFPSFDVFCAEGNDLFDYYFVQPETFTFNTDFFLPRRSKTIILTDGIEEMRCQQSLNHLMTKASQETIIEQLQQYLVTDTPNTSSGDNNKELSSRETDVLQLIARGITNKEIADKLNISLNTVLTHRKNITAKLGIKTVSGLTFYAIMNGIVSGEEF